ncbi:PEP-CTERM sorting domain-containing protein [Rubripirellula reticaptiva]|nr:PEP-CTERM sorting domain-containing protein [Rubripirellula reticaptiva]
MLIAAGFLMNTPEPAQAEVIFDFNFTDALGVGFNANGQTGSDRRQGLTNAGNYLAGFFKNYTATINMDVNGSETGPNTLASAGSNFSASVATNGFVSSGDVRTKILGGDAADPSPALADGTVNWNFANFQWEPFDDFQPGELDLFSTAVHELLHAVGFASSIGQDGSSGFSDPIGAPTAWTTFDQFVADSTGALIDGTFALDTARWNAASVGGAGPVDGLLFNGPNAVLANGGNPVPLYSPATWLGGSSGSHLDTDFFNGTNGNALKMMNHEGAVASGLDTRVISAIEVGILRDIGYTNISAVPEPGSLAFVLASGVAVFVRRRRKA